MDYKTIAVIALAFVVFAVIVGVRWSFGEKYQVTLTDLLLVVTPILIWLVVTGKLGEATLGWKDGLTIKAAANQLLRPSPISVQPLNTADKGSIGNIPQLIEQRVQALKLKINHNDYYDGRALAQYLDQLTKFTFFQYVVINNDQGRLVGAIDARDLRASLSTSGLPLNSNSFADILNSHGDVGDLLRLPGFVSTHFATPRTTNGEALKQMDGANLSWLCVVDDGDFKGIVDRFHVANAIILAVAGKLGAAGSE